MSQTPEYMAWKAMLHRCENAKHPQYEYYGGRGIKVCEQWHKFENFLADMGTRPSPKLSIDRVNNDGNYEPGNCRWATWSQQRRNQRLNRRPSKHRSLLTHMGRSMSIVEWATELGISSNSLGKRLKKMPLEVAMTPSRLPKGFRKRKLNQRGLRPAPAGRSPTSRSDLE
jgi:hypothetical protein